MDHIEHNLCKAMEIIATEIIQAAPYDKTIQAVILSSAEADAGKYKVQYQDSIFYAYTDNTETVYSEGSLVYILIPNNDFSKSKTILGTVDKLGLGYKNAIGGEALYDIIGNNCISTNNQPFVLSTNKKENRILYSKDSKENLLQLNHIAFKEYLKQSSSLICKMDIRTKIKEENQKNGNYGLKVTLSFWDAESSQVVQRIYILDADNMIGNPYQFNAGQNQFEIFNIDGANFIEIQEISLFTENFPNMEENPEKLTKDIEISNLSLVGANLIPEKDLQGKYLHIQTPQGLFLLENQKLSLIAQMKDKGKIVNSNLQKIPFYWFQEDASIDLNSTEYNHYGGRGWKCLNKKVDNAWIPFPAEYEYSCGSTQTYLIKLKCVALYKGGIFTKEISLFNSQFKNNFNLISKNSNHQITSEFFSNQDSAFLECLFNNQSITENNYIFKWTSEDINGQITSLDGNLSTLTFPVAAIYKTALIRCSIFNKTNNTFLGTVSIKLINSAQIRDNYTLVILNGDKIYKYDEYGDSPAGPMAVDPIAIAPLQCALYDNKGALVPYEKYENILWQIPIDHTMLVSPVKDGQLDTQNLDKEPLFAYQIKNRFAYDCINNTITVQMKYKGILYKAQTSITFLKDGQSGTNGTSYSCKIITPFEDYYPALIVDASGAPQHFNFLPSTNFEKIEQPNLHYSIANPFQVKVFNNGEEVSLKNVTITWSMLKHPKDSVNLTFVKNNDILNIEYVAIKDKNSQIIKNISNIIKCTVKYNTDNNNTIILTDTLPLIITYLNQNTEKLELKRDYGFHHVIYNTDGFNPKYINTYPFQLESSNKETLVSWSINGSSLQIKDKEITNKKITDPITVVPNPYYDGYCLTDALVGETSSAYIYIPIHCLINKYGFPHINDWDGNSITVDKDNGYILSPQVGAGRKEEGTFTGILMGEVRTDTESSFNTDIGLLGYNKGIQSFKLDAKNGSATFGSGTGQIIIDPSNNTAKIMGGGYQNNSQTGLLIDLTAPSIQYGNNNFKVDENGCLTAKGGGSIAGWNIDNYNIYSVNNSAGLSSITDLTHPAVKKEQDSQKNFHALAFWAGKQTNNLDFWIGHDGYVKCRNADVGFGTGNNLIHIGGSTVEDNIYSAIYSGQHSTLLSNNNGFYLGADGLSIGSNFKVTADGAITANDGTFKGEITATSLILEQGVTVPMANISGELNGSRIIAGTITTNKIDSKAITTDKIATGAITTNKIDSKAITANKIAAGAITAEKIAAGAIEANKIAAGAITADKIAVGAIEANKIKSISISGGGDSFTVSSTGKVTMSSGDATYFSIKGGRLAFVNGGYLSAKDEQIHVGGFSSLSSFVKAYLPK